MNKVTKVIIGAMSVFELIFSSVTGNIISYATNVPEDIQISNDVMLLNSGTNSTGLLTNKKNFYSGSTFALTLTQTVNWTYGGDTGNYPVASVYNFAANPATGFSYTAIDRQLGEKSIVQGKYTTKYAEIGQYSGGATYLCVTCNNEGIHEEIAI